MYRTPWARSTVHYMEIHGNIALGSRYIAFIFLLFPNFPAIISAYFTVRENSHITQAVQQRRRLGLLAISHNFYTWLLGGRGPFPLPDFLQTFIERRKGTKMGSIGHFLMLCCYNYSIRRHFLKRSEATQDIDKTKRTMESSQQCLKSGYKLSLATCTNLK